MSISRDLSQIEEALLGVQEMAQVLKTLAPDKIPSPDTLLTDEVILELLKTVLDLTKAFEVFDDDRYFTLSQDQWYIFTDKPSLENMYMLIHEFGAVILSGIQLWIESLSSDELSEGFNRVYLGEWIPSILSGGLYDYFETECEYGDHGTEPEDTDEILAFGSSMSPMVRQAFRTRDWQYEDANKSPLLAGFILTLWPVEDPNPWSPGNFYMGYHDRVDWWESDLLITWRDIPKAMALKERAESVRELFVSDALENLSFLFEEICRTGLIVDPVHKRE